MPQTSSTGTVGSSSRRTDSERRSQTPTYCGRFFAMKLATFASVFVGAIPTHVGMPTQRWTRSRRARASGSTSLLLNSPRFRKLSSMEYVSTVDTMECRESPTRRDRSPYRA